MFIVIISIPIEGVSSDIISATFDTEKEAEAFVKGFEKGFDLEGYKYGWTSWIGEK